MLVRVNAASSYVMFSKYLSLRKLLKVLLLFYFILFNYFFVKQNGLKDL